MNRSFDSLPQQYLNDQSDRPLGLCDGGMTEVDTPSRLDCCKPLLQSIAAIATEGHEVYEVKRGLTSA